jgi:hypothetical protein
MTSFISGMHSIIRMAGDAFNVASLFAFGFATIWFKSSASEHFSRIESYPEVSVTGVVEYLKSADVYSNATDIGLAWLYTVATLGCGWMTILGLRWGYHFVLRMLNR